MEKIWAFSEICLTNCFERYNLGMDTIIKHIVFKCEENEIMRKIVSSILIFAIAVSILLTGCSDTPASGNNPNGTKNPSQNTTGSTENDEEAKKKAEEAKPFFQQVLESKFSMPSSFDGWHIIVNDYDGDGRQEAFAFAGIPSGDYWDNFSVCYIDPNGNVTKLRWNSGIGGAPQGTTSTSQNDFSSSCIRYKNQKFVTFTILPDSACIYSMVYGVSGGSVTTKEIGGDGVCKTPEGFIYASGLDATYAYVVKNGRLVDVFDTSDAYKYVDPDYSLKTIPLKQAWKEYTSHSSVGNKEYFLQYDYDGDGRQEAIAIRGYFQNGYASYTEICYIGWGGTILNIGGGNGQLLNITNWNYKTDDSIINAGKQKFMVWQVPGAGHAATYLYGARNGVPYQPQISGNVSYFHQDSDGRYYAEGSQKYTDDEYTFNTSNGEFYKK